MKLGRRRFLIGGGGVLAGRRTVMTPISVEAADANPGGVLSSLRAARPRLLTTPAEIATLDARLAADDVGRRWRAALLRDADRILAQPPVDYTFEPKRPVLLPTSREVLRRMENLGAAWLLTGDVRYPQRVAVELRRVGGFRSWNPSHFLDVAEMTMAVALAYDWCHAALAEEDRALARAAIADKGLVPGVEEYRRRTFWTQATHNWNFVCNGGLAAGALAIAEHEPRLAATVVEASVASSRRALSSYGPDGGWDEGVAYWDYATQYAVFLLASLESALGHDFGLSATPGFADTGLYRLHMEGPGGKAFNFADGGEAVRHTPALMWLARRFGRPLYAWIAGRNATSTGTGIVWFQPDRKAPAETGLPRDAYFRHVESASLRGNWTDRNAMFVAFKAGDNAANHSNLDIGTFVLDAGGERFAVDLGPDDYSLPGYFSADRRYGYYRMGTRGQNTVLIDGANQSAKAKARIVGFRSDEDFARAVADLSPAYSGARSVRRGVALIRRRVTVIADEIEVPAGRKLRRQMHTRAAIRTDGASAELKQGSATLHARIVEPAGAVFTVEPATAPPPENPNTGVVRLCIDRIASAGPARLIVAFAAGGCRTRPRPRPAGRLERLTRQVGSLRGVSARDHGHGGLAFAGLQAEKLGARLFDVAFGAAFRSGPERDRAGMFRPANERQRLGELADRGKIDFCFVHFSPFNGNIDTDPPNLAVADADAVLA